MSKASPAASELRGSRKTLIALLLRSLSDLILVNILALPIVYSALIMGAVPRQQTFFFEDTPPERISEAAGRLERASLSSETSITIVAHRDRRRIAWEAFGLPGPSRVVSQIYWTALGPLLLLSLYLPMMIVSAIRWKHKSPPRPTLSLDSKALMGASAAAVLLVVLSVSYTWVGAAIFNLDAEYAWRAIFELADRIPVLLPVLMIIAAPLVEEAFFRGLLQHRFSSCGRSRLGIWVGAVLFAAFHGSIALFPYFLLFGITMGLLAHYRGLLSAALAHCFVNIAGVTQLLML